MRAGSINLVLYRQREANTLIAGTERGIEPPKSPTFPKTESVDPPCRVCRTEREEQ